MPGRLPRVARSAVFGVFFVSALVLTVLGALLSFSNDPGQVQLAYNILRFNLLLIGVIAVYLGYRVYMNLFAPSHGGSAPLLHRRFVIIFSLAALLPAIIIGAFSASLITQNISALFGTDVRNNMDAAQAVLSDYIDQELAELASDVDILRNGLASRPGGLSDRITLTAELQRAGNAGAQEIGGRLVFPEVQNAQPDATGLVMTGSEPPSLMVE